MKLKRFLTHLLLTIIGVFVFSLLSVSTTHAQGLRVYVANQTSNNVSVIDSSTNSVINTITVGNQPIGLIVSPDKSKVYVANYGDNSVSVIDTSSYTVTTTIPVSANPQGYMAIDHLGKLYVPDSGNRSITVIDTASNTVIATIPVGLYPRQALLSPDETKLYVPNQGDNSVSVIDTATNTVIKTIANVGYSPTGIAITPDGNTLYLANGGDNAVGVLNLTTGTVTTSIPMNLGIIRVIISPDGSKVYASNNNCCTPGQGNGTISVIDTATNTVTAAIPVGTVPNDTDITSDGSRVYVPNSGSLVNPASNTVSVIDTSTNTVIATVTVGLNPFEVAVEKGTTSPTPSPTPTPTPTPTPILTQPGSWSLTGSTNIVRRGFDGTTLPNGKVLIATGLDVPGNFLTSAELYDPTTGTWSYTGNVNTPRLIPFGDLVVLDNGKVLMPAGEGPNLLALSSAELYDPTTGTWSYTGNLNVGRRGPSIVKLHDGRVMVIAGEHNAPDANQFIGSSEFYNVSSGQWTMSQSNLQVARGFGQEAVVLNDGRVLIGGGEGPWLTVGTQAEIYDPATDTWSSAGNMPYAWQGAAMIVLQSGKVLVAGGFDIYPTPGVQNTTNAALDKAALYDPSTNTWSATTSMPAVRSNGRFFLLSDGRVLLTGGSDGTSYDGKDFIYDPTNATWTTANGYNVVRGSAVLAELHDGRQVAIGGISPQGNFLSTVEVYGPVTNHTPTADAGGPYTVDEGGLVQLSGSGTDADNDPLTYKWDLNNDGTYDITGQNAVFSTIDGPSTQDVTLQVCDDKGACATGTATITVNNVAPSLGAITAPSSPTEVNNAVSVSVPFTDPGVLDTHTVRWNWGDNSTSDGSVTESNGSGTATGSHIYTAAGVYTVSVIVTDKDGGSAMADYQYVAIYDPSAGFVTGSGQIDSPLGAEPASSTATGRATFGISATYTSGSTVPTGQSRFIFRNGGFDFMSSSYDWLVVSGTTAYLKGHGVVNGGGSYTFLISVVDGSPDTFRIKITNDADSSVVYDNQMGADGIATPTEAISVGQIQVH